MANPAPSITNEAAIRTAAFVIALIDLNFSSIFNDELYMLETDEHNID